MSNRKSKKKGQEKKPKPIDRINLAQTRLKENYLFERLPVCVRPTRADVMGRNTAAMVNSRGEIFVNEDLWLSVPEWVHVIAHSFLHLAFGHYDLEKMPGYHTTDEDGKKIKVPSYNRKLWNAACDIYVDKFLMDMKLGEGIGEAELAPFPPGILNDEGKLYGYLLETGWPEDDQRYGVGAPDKPDMLDADKPVQYGKGNQRDWMAEFAEALADAASKSVRVAGGHEGVMRRHDDADEAAEWFMAHYPLLGAVATGFLIVRDAVFCRQHDIQIAAVNVQAGEIYINPDRRLTEDEWRFVLAHEYLHAGLDHAGRCQGRDPYLWNIACDFCINGWLHEMRVGTMPESGLYDASFKNMSAEAIYDVILENMRHYRKMDTFRGYGKGDVMLDMPVRNGALGRSAGNAGVRAITGLDDDFYKNALRQGLEYVEQHHRGRGFLPQGLVEEIRAIAVPPIPWDVAFAEWFRIHIDPLEKTRSYAHPSRRQSVTPDIPRPRYHSQTPDSGRTFGVVIDTSGSMEAKEIGIALGAAASYAEANDVPFVRMVFCDADAYDAGYIAPADLMDTVEVKGRGGTILQPGIDLLEQADDFPKDGPILIITDGWIEKNLRVTREHAYLLPMGCRLPFKARGEVFYFRKE